MVKYLTYSTLVCWFCMVIGGIAFGQSGCQSATLTAVITPSDTAFICDGASTQLSGSTTGGLALAWRWSTAETDRDITVNTPGSYFLVVFDQMGCTDTAYVEVVNQARPVINLLPDTTLCAGDSVVIGGGNFTTWAWSTGDTTPTITLSQPTTVAVVVTNQFACADSDTVTISQYPVPIVEIGNDTAVCNGETVLLDGGNGFVAWNWNTGVVSQMLVADSTGTYFVTVTDTYGCQTVSNAVDLVVNVPDVPVITELNSVLSTTQFTAYQWYKDGQVLAGANSDTYTPTEDGVYQVEITDANGCSEISDTLNFILFQEITPEMISRGISPNGDGNFDEWIIPYIEFYPENEVVIFNRWGNTVFSRTGYSNEDPWQGRSDAGKDLTDGVYFFILDLGGDYGKIQGQVVINR